MKWMKNLGKCLIGPSRGQSSSWKQRKENWVSLREDPPKARLEEGVFRGGVDEHRTPSPQTRASHGTKMMPPEALAAAYGRKEWKHFMSDTGMACRSGMARAGWCGRDRPLHFGPWTCGARLGGMPSASCGQDARGSRCGLIGVGCVFHTCLMSLWQLILLYFRFCWFSFYFHLF